MGGYPHSSGMSYSLSIKQNDVWLAFYKSKGSEKCGPFTEAKEPRDIGESDLRDKEFLFQSFKAGKLHHHHRTYGLSPKVTYITSRYLSYGWKPLSQTDSLS